MSLVHPQQKDAVASLSQVHLTTDPAPFQKSSLGNDSRLSASCKNSPKRSWVCSQFLFFVAAICQTPRLLETAFENYALLVT